MKFNTGYRTINLVALCFAGFACISIVVFLTSTQPFFITEVVGLSKGDKIGSVIGTLGVADELVSILTAPLLGTLADTLNNKPWFPVSGTRFVQSSSFIVMAIALFGYGRLTTSIFPDLVFFRCIFAAGVTACLSIITASLNELTNSDYSFPWRRFTQPETGSEPLETSVDPEPLVQAPVKKNGKYAALIGISTGLGAIFSVSFFLTLPPKLAEKYPSLTRKSSLQWSYMIIAGYALMAFILLFVFLYDYKKQSVEEDDPQPSKSYFSLLRDALEQSKKNTTIQLAYVGAFVARSTTVTTSVFIPLLVYNFYYHNGQCDDPNSGVPSKDCHDGYVFSAILTGVAQTVALVSSPFWGWLVDSDRVGKSRSVLIASVVGLVGNYGICLLSNNSDTPFDPRTASCFFMVSMIGLSQIGMIISTMSLLGSVQVDNAGSLSGLYSLSGGVGILLISKLGGVGSDYWILTPFLVLGTFNLVLLVFCASTIRHDLRQRLSIHIE